MVIRIVVMKPSFARSEKRAFGRLIDAPSAG